MDAQVERALLQQISAAQAGTMGAPSAGPCRIGDRVSSSDFVLERERLFSRCFLPVARESDLLEVGQVRALEIADHQLLLTRAADGQLRAFSNVCPHRGAVLVRCEQTKGDKLSCPYHGFTYDLNGRLVSAPDRSSFGSRLDGVGLQELDLALALGWCWVRPEIGGANLSEFLGARLLADLANWELESVERKHGASLECGFNWKIGVEAFLESLHLPSIHGRSAHPLIDHAATAFDLLGEHSMMATPFRSANSYTADGPIGDAARRAGVVNFPRLNRIQSTSNLSYLAFPSTILSFLPNHLTVFSLWPISERKTRFTWELFGAPDASPEATDYYGSMVAGYEALVREDLANLPWIDKGVRDPSVGVPILSRHECRIQAFREAVSVRCE